MCAYDAMSILIERTMSNDIVVCPYCRKKLRLRTSRPDAARIRCPGCEQRFEIGSAAAANSNSLPAGGSEPLFIPLDDDPQASLEAALEQVDVHELSAATIITRRKSRRGAVIMGATLVLLAICALAILTLPRRSAGKRGEEAARKTSYAADSDSPPSAPDLTTGQGLSSPAEQESKRPRRPISLRGMPAGVRVIVHLRPRELWKVDARRDELRTCAKPLVEWGWAVIQSHVQFEPNQIEELTFGLVLKGPGVAPSAAAVVRVADDVPADTIAAQLGTVLPASPSGDRATVRLSEREFVFGPSEYASEMSAAATAFHPTDVALEEILPFTDRSAHVAVVFRPDDVQTHADMLFPERARSFAQFAVDWFAALAVESVAAEFQVRNELDAAVLLRNKADVTQAELKSEVRNRLDGLPKQAMRFVEQLNPQDPGRRRILGRFPAMLKAFTMASVIETTQARLLTWKITLPERAAPNLALATRISWDEMRRVVRSASVQPHPSPAATPVPLAERLQKPITIEFRRTPLHEAVAMIAAEADVPIEVDGAGLQQSGYTRNMPQTMTHANLPAAAALAAIVKQYPQMVVVEESAGRLLVTVKQVAESRKLAPLNLGQNE